MEHPQNLLVATMINPTAHTNHEHFDEIVLAFRMEHWETHPEFNRPVITGVSQEADKHLASKN